MDVPIPSGTGAPSTAASAVDHHVPNVFGHNGELSRNSILACEEPVHSGHIGQVRFDIPDLSVSNAANRG